MGFHGQPVMAPTHLEDLGEVPLTHEEARGGGGGGNSLRADY